MNCSFNATLAVVQKKRISLRRLVLKMSGVNEVQNFTSRDYQTELLEKAKKGNSIVYIGTGSGKTFIALMLIKYYVSAICLKKNFAERRWAVFLTPSVALVSQQAKFLARHSGLKVRAFRGSDGVDDWDEEKWRQEIEKNEVLVFVHQVFLDCIQRKIVFDLKDIALLIFDEVHHTSKCHPYNQIMLQYKKEKQCGQNMPHILGLTASVVTETCSYEKFYVLKQQLEANTNSTILKVDDLASLREHITNPTEVKVHYSTGYKAEYRSKAEAGLCAINKIIADYCSKIETIRLQTLKMRKNEFQNLELIPYEREDKWVKRLINLLSNLSLHTEELGLYACGELVKDFNNDVLLLKRDWAGSSYLRKIADIALEASQSIETIIEDLFKKIPAFSEKDKINFFSTIKVTTLLNLLRSESKEDRELTAMVFVKMRQTAAVLCHIVKKAEMSSLHCEYVAGDTRNLALKQNFAKDMQEKKLFDDKNDKTINLFKIGKINCLICTAIMEEGIDVKRCNLVIRFDKIETFRSYIQAKGRSRSKSSKYVIMVNDSGISDYSKSLSNYEQIERDSLEYCHKEISAEYDSVNDEIEVYYANPLDKLNSAYVTGINAIALVDKYISKLPCDKFTIQAPYFQLETKSADAPSSKQEKLLRGNFSRFLNHK